MKVSDVDNLDPGPHGFFYVEYIVSSSVVPSFKGSSEEDDVLQNSLGIKQNIHVTIQPFDFVLWCPLLYTAIHVFHTFTLVRPHDSSMKHKAPLFECDSEIEKRLSRFPEVNFKIRGFRILLPSSIDLQGLKNMKKSVNFSDSFTIQASTFHISSQVESPISRLVVHKKLSETLTAFGCSQHRSAAQHDTQYKIEMKGLRIWSGCWKELCQMLPKQDTTGIEVDLLEQNPALEWNTHIG